MFDFGSEEEEKVFLALKGEILKEKELVDLMRNQFATDYPSLIGYMQSKLEGLKVKSQSLSRFLINLYRSSQDSIPAENDSKVQLVLGSDTLDSLELNLTHKQLAYMNLDIMMI
jgi:hypothetical protein